MKKHSVNIHGHQTSVTLEDEFWNALKNAAKKRELSLNKLIAEIDDNRSQDNNKYNLSSAIRLYILRELTAPKTP
jgi:predicted DNA-binding ribbon-helix-helix protein